MSKSKGQSKGESEKKRALASQGLTLRSWRGKPDYDPGSIEKKWQEVWKKEGLHKTPENPQNKRYILDMFPYPSGASMHVGHLEGYVGTDILARYLRMKGHDVLHPMGWDSFGLPAENYAIETGIHPEESTRKNIETFKRQLSSAGLSYDWNHEIDTSSPEFYKWTQWLFLLMFKRGLAYKKEADVNWCPTCETVLANEQAVDGKCERCETEVVLKKLDQWFFKITAYADRLISGLKQIDWLNEVKLQQINWIGKAEGAKIIFKVKDSDETLMVFTTREDTLFGATFMVVAPEHPLVERLKAKIENYDEVEKYKQEVTGKTDYERGAARDKTGLRLDGVVAINPVNEKEIPIFVSDFVLMSYGTGAIMSVPAHDERDFQFAKEFGLPIKRVVVGKNKDTSEIVHESQVQEEEGTMVNSDFLNGLSVPDAIDKINNWLAEHEAGNKTFIYHLRDWLISRQRYWGAPIPMVFCQSCADSAKGERKDMPGWFSIPEDQLPVELPTDIDFRPKGESPIARSKSFQEGVVCPDCGGKAEREVDTMDSYVCSSWYFIRFVDSKNNDEFASQESIKEWLPVDVYIGGGHVVQHLLFARFFWKVLFDAGKISESLGDEPFLKLRAPGWILGPDSRKMSKRWGNVVTPDDIIPKYGADTLRMYEMFMGPFDAMKPWSITGVEGMWRFLRRIWKLFEETLEDTEQKENDKKVDALTNKLVKKVGEDIENLHFNTAIASMMEAYNSLIEARKSGAKINWREVWKKFLLLMAPFAPHLSEELWQQLQLSPSPLTLNALVHLQPWPKFDPDLIEEEIIEIPVQVNGRLRGTVKVQSATLRLRSGRECKVDALRQQSETEKLARENERVKKYLAGKQIKKVIFVPGKLINFVLN